MRNGQAGSYVADLFSGSGAVSRQIRKRKVKAREFDIKYGKDGDLLEPSFRRLFSADVKEGRILAVMIATPCSSFSLAQSRGGKALRSREYPRGIPQSVTERERHRVELGNACLDVTIFYYPTLQ